MIIFTRIDNARHRVRAHKIDQMSNTTKACLFQRRSTTRTKVMQAEGQYICIIVAGFFQGGGYDLANIVGNCCHRGRIPHSAQKRCFHEGWQPEKIGISVAYLDQRRTNWHHHAFRQCLDQQWQPAIVTFKQQFPALSIEWQAMGCDQFVCLIHIRQGYAARQIFLQKHLQAKKQHMIVPTAGAGLNIG